ncbi:MAG: hypothetical protein WCK31_00875 [bacterium]
MEISNFDGASYSSSSDIVPLIENKQNAYREFENMHGNVYKAISKHADSITSMYSGHDLKSSRNVETMFRTDIDLILASWEKLLPETNISDLESLLYVLEVEKYELTKFIPFESEVVESDYGTRYCETYYAQHILTSQIKVINMCRNYYFDNNIDKKIVF